MANPEGMAPDLVLQKAQERRFLEQLLDPSTLDVFRLPVPIKAELRSYQQAGLNWMHFLNKYQLHGILCDDMGLGKTLQSICILAANVYERAQRFGASGHADAQRLPSLVVCPPTLTSHWVYEVQKFCSEEHLRPLLYAGKDRKSLRSQFDSYDLVILSYDVLRNEIDYFKTRNFSYCILDEGHIIKVSHQSFGMSVFAEAKIYCKGDDASKTRAVFFYVAVCAYTTASLLLSCTRG